MTWQPLILLQTVFVALSIITLRVLARDKRIAKASFVISAVLYVGLYATVLICLPWLGKVDPHALDAYWWRFAGGGLLFALTNVWTFKTLVYFDAAIGTIAGTINAIFAVLGAELVLHEALTIQQYAGAAILLLAISYGVLATHRNAKRSIHRSAKLGAMYALLAGIGYAIAVLNEKSLLGHMSPATYSVYGIGVQTVITAILALAIQPKKFSVLLLPRVAGWSVLTGALRGIGAMLFIITEVKSNNVALAAVVSNFRLIIVIFLGAWLLKEHHHMKQKLTAAATAIAGVGIMFWR